jgi:cytochrome c peroxidase
MKKLLLLSTLSCALLTTSCKDEKFEYFYYTPEETSLLSKHLNLPSLPNSYDEPLPNYLIFSGGGGFTNNTVQAPVIELGRVLFYDKNLSKDGKISCASCHKQALAFSDDAPVSKGVFDRSGERNSIALSSVPSFAGAYSNTGVSLFWDNRAQTVQEQSRASLANTKEMDMSMSEVVEAVRNQPYYDILFKKAFNSPEITEDRVTEAIQGFVHALSSFHSKFDVAAEARFNQNNQDFNFIAADFANLSAQENLGKSLYLNNCASCHTNTLTVPRIAAASNGLDQYPSDPGVGGINNNQFNMGTFKIPALRNVGLTAPYMHDGRFQTLEQVVEHYSSGIQPHVNLHNELKKADGTPKNLQLTVAEKQALVAFLHTLSDHKMATDARFADPFK